MIELVDKKKYPGTTYWHPPGPKNIIREARGFARFTRAVALNALPAYPQSYKKRG